MASYHGVITAEMMREVQKREVMQMFLDQMEEIDEGLKCALADDPTITNVEFEFEYILDETIDALVSAGYNVDMSGVEDDGTVIMTVSWDEDDSVDGDCCCKPCC